MWFYVICIFLPVNQSCSSQPIQLGGPRGEKLSVQLEVLSLRFRRWATLHSIPNPAIPNGSKYGMHNSIMKSLAVGLGHPRFWPTMTLFVFLMLFFCPRTQQHWKKNRVTLLHYKCFILTIDLNFETGFLFRSSQLVTSMRSQGNWDWRLGIPVW